MNHIRNFIVRFYGLFQEIVLVNRLADVLPGIDLAKKLRENEKSISHLRLVKIPSCRSTVAGVSPAAFRTIMKSAKSFQVASRPVL